MKQSIITLIIVGAVGYGYYELRQMRVGFAFAKGETRAVQRGDITIPISATGVIAPVKRYEVKSKASGEVTEILKKPGELIGKDELLIRLDKSDEQRGVDRAQADVTRTRATLEMSKIKKNRLETIGRRKAQALVDQLTARLDRAAFQYEKIKSLRERQRASEEEWTTVKSTYDDTSAQLQSAKADLEDIKTQIQQADQEIVLNQAAYDQALSNLGDARERLAETEIHSPVDGMVVKINTQVGAVIQGGKTTFTGGTVLAVVADISKLYVTTDVDEADIGTVRELAPEWAKPGQQALPDDVVPTQKGAPVIVRVDSFHGEEFTGIIERIHPEPSQTIPIVTYQVDVLLTSDNRTKLLAGMQADVEFTAQSAYDVVLVPHDAIRKNEFGKLGVYIPDESAPEEDQPAAKFVPCRLGLDNGMFAEVLEGLQEGQKVYVKLPRKIGRKKDDT